MSQMKDNNVSISTYIYIYIHLHAYAEPGFLTTQALKIRIFGTANGQIDDSLGEVVGAFLTKK